jgi:hypothetical protein
VKDLIRRRCERGMCLEEVAVKVRDTSGDETFN